MQGRARVSVAAGAALEDDGSAETCCSAAAGGSSGADVLLGECGLGHRFGVGRLDHFAD